MSTVADITVSVDGFVTGPDPGPELGLGFAVVRRCTTGRSTATTPFDAAILREVDRGHPARW